MYKQGRHSFNKRKHKFGGIHYQLKIESFASSVKQTFTLHTYLHDLWHITLFSQLMGLKSSAWSSHWILKYICAIILTGLHSIRFSQRDLQSKMPSKMCYSSLAVEKAEKSNHHNNKLFIIMGIIHTDMCLVCARHYSKARACVCMCVCSFNSIKNHIM